MQTNALLAWRRFYDAKRECYTGERCPFFLPELSRVPPPPCWHHRAAQARRHLHAMVNRPTVDTAFNTPPFPGLPSSLAPSNDWLLMAINSPPLVTVRHLPSPLNCPYKRRPTSPLFPLSQSLSTTAAELLLHCCFITIA
jgi:hypothetical protein